MADLLFLFFHVSMRQSSGPPTRNMVQKLQIMNETNSFEKKEIIFLSLKSASHDN